MVYQGELSEWAAYLTGVPQGSVWGPLLFSFAVNSILDSLQIGGLDGLLFADDLSAYAIADTVEDASSLLSRGLSTLDEWSSLNGMVFNKQDKCVVSLFTRRNGQPLPKVRFGDVTLRHDEHPRYLGAYLDRRMSFNYHVHMVVAKARRALGFVRRVAGGN